MKADATVLGQVDNCYIVAASDAGMYIVDQHAAHERILYNRFSLAADRIPTQQLLLPIYLDLDPQEMNLVLDSLDTLRNLGLTLETTGPNSIRLTELPADLKAADAEPFLRDILGSIQSLRNIDAAQLRHVFLQTAACRAAIKAGDTLNTRQMQALLNELFQTQGLYTCPHGRPTTIFMSREDLAKKFKRT